MLIQRHESCIGLSLPAFGRYKIEVWFAPRGYSIKEHTHPNENIKLLFLFGSNIRFHRRQAGFLLGESFFATFRNIGKIFTINAGDAHWFEVSDWPLIFVNFETWLNGKPSSAAKDLTYTNYGSN